MFHWLELVAWHYLDTKGGEIFPGTSYTIEIMDIGGPLALCVTQVNWLKYL